MLVPAGQLGGIDLADDVGELRARGQPLGVAPVARPPGDGHLRLGQFRQQPLAPPRVIGRQGSSCTGQPGMSRYGTSSSRKRAKQPHQPALALPLLAQEQHVVLGDQAQVDLGDDRVFVADDAGKQLLALAEHPHEIVVDFPLHRLGRQPL